jgi:hypothetical protein
MENDQNGPAGSGQPHPPAPDTKPIEVTVQLPESKRDLAWWLTSFTPTIISVAALIVAALAFLDQHTINSSTEAAARTAGASLVSVWQTESPANLAVQNLGSAPIYDVWLNVGLQYKGAPKICCGGGGSWDNLGWSVDSTPDHTTYQTWLYLGVVPTCSIRTVSLASLPGWSDFEDSISESNKNKPSANSADVYFLDGDSLGWSRSLTGQLENASPNPVEGSISVDNTATAPAKGCS